MSELNYGVNVENLLHDLSQHESSDIGEFEVYGEDEQGREGCASIDITLLASDALKVIADLKSQHAALLGGFEEAIKHKDKLAAELNALAAENAALQWPADIIRALNANPEAARFFGFEDEQIDNAVEAMSTPATDAYLNSVRADAISNALDSCNALCDTDCVMDVHDISYEDAALRSAGAIALHDQLIAIAATLRAGKDGE